MYFNYLKQCCLILIVALSPINKNISSSNPWVEKEYSLTLEEVVIKPKKYKKASTEFLGFKLSKPLNTKVDDQLIEALKSYNGPAPLITSLRRFGTSSQHCCGKAVDFNWDPQVIEYLMTDEGQLWLDSHNLNLYIEAKPGDKALLPYKNNKITKKYVFENKGATAPHIHINIKRK